jgi:hypothetical protein
MKIRKRKNHRNDRYNFQYIEIILEYKKIIKLLNFLTHSLFCGLSEERTKKIQRVYANSNIKSSSSFFLSFRLFSSVFHSLCTVPRHSLVVPFYLAAPNHATKETKEKYKPWPKNMIWLRNITLNI